MIVINTNPESGTSSNGLRIIHEAGYKPVIVDYLTVGWTKSQLLGLFAAADITPREALRVTKSPAERLGLLNESISDEDLISAMLTHPILVNRPIVCSPKGVKLCRPSESVLSLIDVWPQGPFFKEDGEQILDKALKSYISNAHTEALQQLATHNFGKLYFLPGETLDAASSAIREQLKKTNKNNELLPEPVSHYIKQHQLYQSDD